MRAKGQRGRSGRRSATVSYARSRGTCQAGSDTDFAGNFSADDVAPADPKPLPRIGKGRCMSTRCITPPKGCLRQTPIALAVRDGGCSDRVCVEAPVTNPRSGLRALSASAGAGSEARPPVKSGSSASVEAIGQGDFGRDLSVVAWACESFPTDIKVPLNGTRSSPDEQPV